MPIDFHGGKIKNVRALIYKVESGEKYFLITQEREGNYTLPGGCKDVEDSDLMTAVKRELREELGITDKSYSIQEAGISREHPNLYTHPKSDRFGKNTILSLFIGEYHEREIIYPSDGIAGFLWLNEEEAEKILSGPMKELFLIGLRWLNGQSPD